MMLSVLKKKIFTLKKFAIMSKATYRGCCHRIFQRTLTELASSRPKLFTSPTTLNDAEYCILNPNTTDFNSKRNRIEEIGRELSSVVGVDAMENMFYSLEFRIKDEIGHDVKSYRSWWNGITVDWKY